MSIRRSPHATGDGCPLPPPRILCPPAPPPALGLDSCASCALDVAGVVMWSEVRGKSKGRLLLIYDVIAQVPVTQHIANYTGKGHAWNNPAYTNFAPESPTRCLSIPRNTITAPLTSKRATAHPSANAGLLRQIPLFRLYWSNVDWRCFLTQHREVECCGYLGLLGVQTGCLAVQLHDLCHV